MKYHIFTGFPFNSLLPCLTPTPSQCSEPFVKMSDLFNHSQVDIDRFVFSAHSSKLGTRHLQ